MVNSFQNINCTNTKIKEMESDDSELSEDQLLAIDKVVERCTKLDRNQNLRIAFANTSNRHSGINSQRVSGADNFEGITDEQFAMMDKDVEKCAEKSNQNEDGDALSSLETSQTENELPTDLFGDLTEEQFAGLDEAVEKATNNANQTTNEPSLDHIKCLQQRFGHTHFKPEQWEIIHAVMIEKRDACAVMATGYGKSLCFQFPAVYKNGMVLVISPLISLMQAQVIALNESKIPACLVGTALYDKQIISRIDKGEFNLIYSSPEYLQGREGRRMLYVLQNRLTLIAIDESHCVSAWGLDFRPDFRKLDVIRSIISDTPILALTATATDKVRHDIKSSLGLRNPCDIVTSFDRPNLEFIVHEKSDVWGDLRQWVTNVSNGSVIVYVLKRTEAEEIATTLTCHGIKCQPYHAGMDKSSREYILKEFLKDELKVIVATTAFGMGIDKKDIRTVVHYGSSKNLESYYQEVGRAGRDGLPSKVVTYFEIKDFDLHDWFLEKENEQKKLSNFVKKFLRNLTLAIREFVYSTECRRKMILNYFGEETSSLTTGSNCCDNCSKGLNSWKLCDLYVGIDGDGLFDFAKDADILFNAIRSMEVKDISPERNLVVNLLRGKNIRILQKLPAHGKGIGRQPYYWDALIDQLISAEYIDYAAGKTCLTLDANARQWCSKPHPKALKLKPVGCIYKFFTRKPSTPLTNIHYIDDYEENVPIRGVVQGENTWMDFLFGSLNYWH